MTDDATFWVADLRGVRRLPDNALAGQFGEVNLALAFPLGPGPRPDGVTGSRDDIGQQEVLAAAQDDLGLTDNSGDWFSRYRVHHRIAQTTVDRE